MLYFDTETCGFHGPIVIMQYAYDDDDVEIHSPWYEPIDHTLHLYEDICYHLEGVCGFNLAFDWFHLCQQYTTLLQLSTMIGRSACPIDHINEYVEAEYIARDGPCMKPVTALDLMLHARKGPYQSLMNRKPIRIKRIPTPIAQMVADELSKRIVLKDVYFARKSNPKKRWSVVDTKDPQFKDLVLDFAPSSALKALCADIGLIDENRVLMKDFAESLPKPTEYGYAPYAKALKRGEIGWPLLIRDHIREWEYNEKAKSYAIDDVIDTRRLHKYFSCEALGLDHEECLSEAFNWSGRYNLLPSGDDDSILACMVGAVRWRGFIIDTDRLSEIRHNAATYLAEQKYNLRAPAEALHHLHHYMGDTEKIFVQDTKAATLEIVRHWKEETVCDDCKGEGCKKCADGFVKSDEPHPAAKVAEDIIQYRQACKRIELIDKILHAGRFHASFVVIGTKSSRMAGGDDLNAQGIDHSKEIRECFKLYHNGMMMSGGDFDGFELTIMAAAFPDTKLIAELESGEKLHALWGSRYFFPECSIEEIKSTSGLPGTQDKYLSSKKGVFAICYFGEAFTLVKRVGIAESQAEQAYRKIMEDYTEFSKERNKIISQFCSMRQPSGIGTKVEWHDPADYVESLLGFRRYFTLENRICKTIFELANKPPREWAGAMSGKVVRRDREQTPLGAVQSALYAVAFAIQAANMRAAGNHRIQSTGATITKRVECEIWEIQPVGINDWLVMPINIHDEVIAPHKPEVKDSIKERVDRCVETFRPIIPLIKMKWKQGISSWAGK